MEPRLFLVFARDEVLHLHLGGNFNQLELQQNYFEALDFLAAKKLSKLAVDVTKLIEPEDAIHFLLQKNWQMPSEEKGLKAMAVITAKKILNQFKESGRVLINNQDPLRYYLGDDKNLALKWLSDIS